MAAICPTCGSKLTCGCQLRSASDGARVCSLCIARYEKSLKDKKAKQVATPPDKPVQNVSINTTPTNMKVMYNPPQKK